MIKQRHLWLQVLVNGVHLLVPNKALIQVTLYMVKGHIYLKKSTADTYLDQHSALDSGSCLPQSASLCLCLNWQVRVRVSESKFSVATSSFSSA